MNALKCSICCPNRPDLSILWFDEFSLQNSMEIQPSGFSSALPQVRGGSAPTRQKNQQPMGCEVKRKGRGTNCECVHNRNNNYY